MCFSFSFLEKNPGQLELFIFIEIETEVMNFIQSNLRHRPLLSKRKTNRRLSVKICELFQILSLHSVYTVVDCTV